MRKTCATIATIEKGKQKWHIYASTKTNLIIQVDYARIVILPSITSRENKNFQSRNFRITKVKTILKNQMAQMKIKINKMSFDTSYLFFVNYQMNLL